MQSLKEVVRIFISSLLDRFSSHPLIVPFLNVSRESQLEYYLHQFEVIARLAPRVPVRAFIADEIGLGKTITAIAIAKYLETTDRTKRTLIIVPRVLIPQWRRELIRMGISGTRIYNLERSTIGELESRGFPEGYYIVSMDLLKREKHLKKVKSTTWDLVIVDEAHRLSYRTKRFRSIGKNIIEVNPDGRNVLFLSATPHKGDIRDYIERLRLLDPFLIADWKRLDRRDFYEVTHDAIIFRRTKEDINKIYEDRPLFPPAHFYACLIEASEREKAFARELVSFLRDKLVKLAEEKRSIGENVIPLLTVLIFKRASSCPYSAYTTMQRLLTREARVDKKRLKKLIVPVRSFFKTGYEDYEYEDIEKSVDEIFDEFLRVSSALLSKDDVSKVEQLMNMANEIMKNHDTKFNFFCELLKRSLEQEQGSKVVVFTEYKDTLEYLFENLIRRYPEWRESILKLSSDETRDEEKFKEIKGEFEKNPTKRLLIATDVVAEGINLQVANVLINYEIPWSLVKLEQRVGRVWRLGQQKKVEVYTIFVDNVADNAALRSMYIKLLNLKKAELRPKLLTGEEVLLYSEEKPLKIPRNVVVDTVRGKKVYKRITEYETIQTFIRDGAEGLERLAEKILAAKRELENKIGSRNVLLIHRSRESIKKTIEALGFSGPSELMGSLKQLVKSVAPLLEFDIQEDSNGDLRIVKGFEMPRTLSTLDDFFSFLRAKSKYHVAPIISYGEDEDTLSVVNVEVTYNNIVVYKEPVGLFLRSEKILRGADLILELSRALSNCIGTIQEIDSNIPRNLEALIESRIRDSLGSLLSPLSDYRDVLVRKHLRNQDRWPGNRDFRVRLSKPFSYVVFVKRHHGKKIAISEEDRRRIEREAVNFVLKVESDEGRKAEEVPGSEHYDIRSIDPKTGEVRKIEVKGHAGFEIYGELTDSEAELARKEGDNYWLYIVYGIKSGHPKLLRFRNPLKTMNWEVIERVEKRYIFRPKE